MLWDVPPIATYPYTGSVIDLLRTSARCGPTRTTPAQTIGTRPPPLRNLPNRVGEDPHGAPRGIAGGLAEVSNFLQVNGAIAQRLRPQALLRGRLDRALIRPQRRNGAAQSLAACPKIGCVAVHDSVA